MLRAFDLPLLALTNRLPALPRFGAAFRHCNSATTCQGSSLACPFENVYYYWTGYLLYYAMVAYDCR